MTQTQVFRHLFLMHRELIKLSDEEAIFNLVCRGLLEIPGVAAVRYSAVSGAVTDPDTVTIPVAAGENVRGNLIFTVASPELFAPCRDYLENFCFTLAVILQERAGRRQNEQYHPHLEEMVQERTRRLQAQIDEDKLMEESLRHNRKLLSDAEAISRMGSWEYVVARHRMTWSDETYRIYELPPDCDPNEIDQDNFYPPSNRQIAKLAFSEALQQGKGFDLELCFITAQGNKKWIRTIGRTEMHGGKVIRVFGNVADITERKKYELELQTASQLWRSTFDAMLDPVAYLGVDGEIKQCNRAFADFCGRDIKTLRGRKCHQVIHHTESHIANCPFVRVLQSGVREAMVLKIDDKFLFVVADPVKGPDGRIIGVVHIIRDITEQTRAKEALEESREKYRLVAETAHDFILTTDLDYNITFANKAVENLLGGHSPIGLRLDDFIPPSSREKGQAMMDQRRVGVNDAFSFEWEMSDFNNRSYIFDVRSQLLTKDGKPSGVLYIARDITGRKQAEAEIRALNERYEMATSSAAIGVWDRDLKTNRLIWDDRMYALYGISREQFAGTSDAWRAMIHPDDVLRVDNNLKELIQSEKDYYTEFRIVWPDGQIRHIRAFGRVQRDEHGHPVRLIGVNYDITWRMQAEEERRKLEKQLFEAQKMEAIGTLAGGIAHDFNNILAAIIGYAELVRDTHEETQRKENIKRLIRSAERAKNLVNQILAFSRRVDYDQKPLDMRIIIKEEIKLLRATMPATIDIRQSIPNTPFMVKADLTQMHQVVMNICTNAAQAMGEKGGILRVVLAKEDLSADPLAEALHLSPGCYVKLSIADTGPGIEPVAIDHIFEPFFTTKKIGEGTGLGLSVVYGIIKNHKGSVHADNKPGEGAVFHIYLPCLEDTLPVRENIPKTVIPHGREKILFVDDEKDLTELAEINLTDLGYHVTVCSDSREALNIFRSNPDGFDLVITDMTMPHLSGSELAQQLQKLRPGQPIILCTGYSYYMNAEKAAELGIKAFLFKPVSRQNLAATVRKALDENRNA